MGNWKQPFKTVRQNRNIPNIITNESMITTFANNRFSREPIQLRIVIKALIGNGSFGRVYKAQMRGSEEPVALKHCYFNARYQQREVEIFKQLEDHCNIVKLIMHSNVILGNPPKGSIILIMEYMPMNLLEYIKGYRNNQQPKEAEIYVRILSYQMFRGLGYLHSLGICHRDIKPDNLLVDSQSMQLKLADFGTAKNLVKQTPNLTYVGSRLYRAPQLFAKYDCYDCSIDIWSAGCVLAELLKGTPLFESNKVDLEQLHHMVSLLGTEGLHCAQEVHSVCAGMDYAIRPSWDHLLQVDVPPDLSDLLNSCLVYESAGRILPMVACAHVAYDTLRIMDTLGCRMPNGQKLPPLFNFIDQELGLDEKLRVDLLPLHLSELAVELEKTDVAANEDVQS
ncbi:glycogen synthase kinase-3 alpha [Drosophila kikkawai]|uniref:Glycogen synthase kinase-3 alpha n=1 Tax=Drosophila kikkawai TaxID=30033 RepID=A0A6P4IRA9_DROKI|nr:glycogen synthase kinase-3 alpha [Drosophila kikkawai]